MTPAPPRPSVSQRISAGSIRTASRGSARPRVGEHGDRRRRERAPQKIPTRSVGRGIGHFFGALRIDAFIDPRDFKRQIDVMRRTLRATRPAPGTDGPLIPGDPERDQEAIRTRVGIALLPAVVDELRHISRETGIPFG
jgi:LDH2 family malate/lactate/ureidoglycolate dehydrogenase